MRQHRLRLPRRRSRHHAPHRGPGGGAWRAHRRAPGYPDLVGFGRRSLACSAQEVEDLLLYQIGALDGLCRAQGTRVRYVKPHGALYQDMMRDPAILAAVLRALAAYDRTPAADADEHPRQHRGARAGHGPRHRAVVRGVRRPRLRRRRLPGLAQPARRGTPRRRDGARPGPPAGPWRALRASDGSALALEAQTLCVHGDNPASLAAVRRIRDALEAA